MKQAVLLILFVCGVVGLPQWAAEKAGLRPLLRRFPRVSMFIDVVTLLAMAVVLFQLIASK